MRLFIDDLATIKMTIEASTLHPVQAVVSKCINT